MSLFTQPCYTRSLLRMFRPLDDFPKHSVYMYIYAQLLYEYMCLHVNCVHLHYVVILEAAIRPSV